MGILTRLRALFTPTKPPDSEEPGPLQLSERARERLSELPEQGLALRLSTHPAPGGRQVQAQEVTGEGDAQGLILSDDDRQRLRGLELDRGQGGWMISLRLALYAQRTPNPDAQHYLTSRPLARGRSRFFDALTPDSPMLVRRLLSIDGVRSALLRDNTVSIEREPGTPWVELDANVDAALRAHFLMCGEPLPDPQEQASEDELEQAVLRVLTEDVLPAVHKDGGDIELVEVVDGVARVHLVGACASCPSSTVTLHKGVERALKRALPGQITGVQAV